ncbi:unnamed protein product [Closterium sp. NIES-54]
MHSFSFRPLQPARYHLHLARCLLQPAHRPTAARPAAARPAAAPPCWPPHHLLQPVRHPFAARSPPLAARASPLAARSLPLAARSPPFGQPARHPFAACSPPCAACVPPFAPVHPPAAARPAAHSPAGWRPAGWRPAARRPAACPARLLPTLLRTALLAGALLPAPPGCCPPCCAPVVDDYTRYTTVFPLRSKGEVPDILQSVSSSASGSTRTFLSCVCTLTEVYAAHQLNVSLLETSPTQHWMGKVGDASVFRLWGSRAFVRDTSADKLSSRAIPCGPAPSGVSQVDPLPSTVPVEVAVDSGAASGDAEPGGAEPDGAEPGGAVSEGAESGGAEPGGAEPGGTEPESAEPGGAASKGADFGGAEPRGTASTGGPAGTSPRLSPRREPLSPQQLREWFAQRTRPRSGAAGAGGSAAGGTRAGGVGATSLGGAGVTAGAGGIRGAGAGGTGAKGTRAGGTGAGDSGAGGTDAGGAGAGGAGAGDLGAGGARDGGTGAGGATVTASGAGGTGAGGAGAGGAGAGERPEPESRPASPVHTVRTGRRVPRPRPPPVPSTHYMALRPFSVPLRVPLPSPPATSLPDVPDPESDLDRAASPTVPHLLATVVTDPSFESTAASALVAELVDFAAACHLNYATSLVADLSLTILRPSRGDPDAPDISTPRSYAEVIMGPYSSQWQTTMDAKMAPWKSTGTYVDAVPPSGANIVDGMWIFRVKRPPGSQPVFKARYVARGFNQRQGVDFFLTFSPTPKMTTLRVLLHVAAQRDYELHSLDFSTAFLQGSLHEEIWLRRPCGFTGSFPAGTQWSLRRYLGLQITRDRAQHTITLTQSHMVHQVLQRFGFEYSLPQSTPLLTGHSLSAPPSHESVEPSGPYSELMGCLMVLRYLCSTSGMWLLLGGQGPVVLIGHADASWVDDLATQRSSQGYTFNLGSGSVSWRSTRSSSVLSSSCEGEIYAGAMAAQELCLLTYLLTDLGEQPRSSPVLYVDNKAMIALCQEPRLEHRTKHIALRYFLAQELQQRGELRLAYVATRANSADIFTKALQSAHTAYGARGDGARDLQIGSIRTHSATRAHKQAVYNLEKSEAEKAKQATLTRWQITDSSTRHIIRLLHIALFVCTADAPIAMFVPLCWFLAKEGLPDLPPSGGYGSYYIEFKENRHALSTYLQVTQRLHLLESPWIGISLDESTDRVHGKHPTLHATFFKRTSEVTEFLTLITVDCADAASLTSAVMQYLTVIGRLLDVLPAAVVVLKDYKKELYEVVTSFKFHWLIRFLADVLWELNALNKRFQQRQREMKAEGVDGDGNPVYFVYELHEHRLPGHETDGDVTACVELSIKFVRAVDAELEWQMRNLNLLEGTKLFRTASYVSDDSKCVETFKKWLGLLHKLHNHKLPGFDYKRDGQDLWMFTSTMFSQHNNEEFHQALGNMLRDDAWRVSFPNIMSMWQSVVVLPLSTVECERGFSKQNLIKTWGRGSLGNTILEHLMRCSLLRYDVDWYEVVAIFRGEKLRRSTKEFDASRASDSKFVEEVVGSGGGTE